MTDKTEAPELKPCPFCGEKPRYSERLDEDLATHNQVIWKTVNCPECDVSFSIPDGYESGTAAEQWNNRTDACAEVKPLVWEEPSAANNYCHIARTPIGDYYVNICGGRHNAFLEQHVKPYEVEIGETVGSVFEAQSFANDHWIAEMAKYRTTRPAPPACSKCHGSGKESARSGRVQECRHCNGWGDMRSAGQGTPPYDTHAELLVKHQQLMQLFETVLNVNISVIDFSKQNAASLKEHFPTYMGAKWDDLFSKLRENPSPQIVAEARIRKTSE